MIFHYHSYIALEWMYEPVTSIHFNGRTPAEQRGALFQEFKDDKAKVLLMFRAARGIGFDITTANVVIQCGPWWKKEWEIQGITCVQRRSSSD
jgi:SNF2 family DNA or RNA helicase